MVNIFYTTSTSYLGILLGIIHIIPWVLMVTVLKPKYTRNKTTCLSIVNKVVYIINIALMMAFTNKFQIKNADVIFAIALFFYIIYIEMFLKYVIKGRMKKTLYERLIYVIIPFFISMSMSLVFLAIWSKNIILILISIISALLNICIEYNNYINNYTEYRELFDAKRKHTGKKMLKDGIQPKGLKYVTVSVFIYNPVNKKFLMQKRTKDKGGKWATTSGHPVYGKNSVQGMITEIKEELGLTVDEKELILIDTVERENKFVDIYYLEKDIDINNIKIQKEELDEVKWMSKNDIEKCYINNNFKKTHYNYYKQLQKRMK